MRDRPAHRLIARLHTGTGEKINAEGISGQRQRTPSPMVKCAVNHSASNKPRLPNWKISHPVGRFSYNIVSQDQRVLGTK